MICCCHVATNKLVLKQIWTCLLLQMTVDHWFWHRIQFLILSKPWLPALKLKASEELSPPTNSSWGKLHMSNHLYIHNPETFRVPEFNQSPSEISIPFRCRGCFQKVYLALAWSRIDERQLTPCQCLSQSKLEPCRPVFPILSIQNVTSTSFCHSLISYHHGKNGDVT